MNPLTLVLLKVLLDTDLSDVSVPVFACGLGYLACCICLVCVHFSGLWKVSLGWQYYVLRRNCFFIKSMAFRIFRTAAIFCY